MTEQAAQSGVSSPDRLPGKLRRWAEAGGVRSTVLVVLLHLAQLVLIAALLALMSLSMLPLPWRVRTAIGLLVVVLVVVGLRSPFPGRPREGGE